MTNVKENANWKLIFAEMFNAKTKKQRRSSKQVEYIRSEAKIYCELWG